LPHFKLLAQDITQSHVYSNYAQPKLTAKAITRRSDERAEQSGAERSRTAADDLMRRRRDIGLQSQPATHTAAHDAVHDSLVISRRYRATISHTRRRSVVVVDVAKSLQSQRIRDRLAAAFDAALDTVRQICRVPDFDESTE